MKFKKLAVLALAFVMAFSLAAPTFAVDLEDADALAEGAEVTFTSTVEVPTLKVTVPTSGSVVVNPYKLEVELEAAVEADEEAGTPAKEAVTTKDQIISAAQNIENYGTVPVSVNVTASGEAAEGVTLASASVAANTKLTDKSMFLYVKVVPTTASKAEDDSVEIAEVATWGAYSKSTDVVVSAEETTKDNIATIPAKKTVDNEAEDGTVDLPGVVAFRLLGDAVSAPAEGWTTDDTVTVKLVFTFTSVASAA